MGVSTVDRLSEELVELLRDQGYPADAARIPEFVAWFNGTTKAGEDWTDLEVVDHLLCDESFFHACGRWFRRRASGEGD